MRPAPSASAVRRRLGAEHGLSDADVDELARELGAWLEPRLRALLAGEAQEEATRGSPARAGT